MCGAYNRKFIKRRGINLEFKNDICIKDIEKNTKTSFLGKKVIYLETVDSTSDYAFNLALNGCAAGTVVIAHTQTAGRGSLKRKWYSFPGKGIWMSVITHLNFSPAQQPIIHIATAVALVQAIKNATGIITGIKWPNDIILDSKKVCGILNDIHIKDDKIDFLLTGIGLNISQQDSEFPIELREKAISLMLFLNQHDPKPEFYYINILNKTNIIIEILSELEKVFRDFEENNITSIIGKWKEFSVTLGKEVKFTIENGHEYTGIAQDITNTGEIVIKYQDGTCKCFLPREISIRGIYGYV